MAFKGFRFLHDLGCWCLGRLLGHRILPGMQLRDPQRNARAEVQVCVLQAGKASDRSRHLPNSHRPAFPTEPAC